MNRRRFRRYARYRHSKWKLQLVVLYINGIIVAVSGLWVFENGNKY